MKRFKVNDRARIVGAVGMWKFLNGKECRIVAVDVLDNGGEPVDYAIQVVGF